MQKSENGPPEQKPSANSLVGNVNAYTRREDKIDDIVKLGLSYLVAPSVDGQTRDSNKEDRAAKQTIRDTSQAVSLNAVIHFVLGARHSFHLTDDETRDVLLRLLALTRMQ